MSDTVCKSRIYPGSAGLTSRTRVNCHQISDWAFSQKDVDSLFKWFCIIEQEAMTIYGKNT